jgi:hypothetical protein
MKAGLKAKGSLWGLAVAALCLAMVLTGCDGAKQEVWEGCRSDIKAPTTFAAEGATKFNIYLKPHTGTIRFTDKTCKNINGLSETFSWHDGKLLTSHQYLIVRSNAEKELKKINPSLRFEDLGYRDNGVKLYISVVEKDRLQGYYEAKSLDSIEQGQRGAAHARYPLVHLPYFEWRDGKPPKPADKSGDTYWAIKNTVVPFVGGPYTVRCPIRPDEKDPANADASSWVFRGPGVFGCSGGVWAIRGPNVLGAFIEVRSKDLIPDIDKIWLAAQQILESMMGEDK